MTTVESPATLSQSELFDWSAGSPEVQTKGWSLRRRLACGGVGLLALAGCTIAGRSVMEPDKEPVAQTSEYVGDCGLAPELPAAGLDQIRRDVSGIDFMLDRAGFGDMTESINRAASLQQVEAVWDGFLRPHNADFVVDGKAGVTVEEAKAASRKLLPTLAITPSNFFVAGELVFSKNMTDEVEGPVAGWADMSNGHPRITLNVTDRVIGQTFIHEQSHTLDMYLCPPGYRDEQDPLMDGREYAGSNMNARQDLFDQHYVASVYGGKSRTENDAETMVELFGSGYVPDEWDSKLMASRKKSLIERLHRIEPAAASLVRYLGFVNNYQSYPNRL